MTNKEVGEVFDRHNLGRGDVCPYQGYRSKYWFGESPSNIANFIMQHADTQNAIILESCKNNEQRGFYIDPAINRNLSKLSLMREIEAKAFKQALCEHNDMEDRVHRRNGQRIYAAMEKSSLLQAKAPDEPFRSPFSRRSGCNRPYLTAFNIARTFSSLAFNGTSHPLPSMKPPFIPSPVTSFSQ